MLVFAILVISAMIYLAFPMLKKSIVDRVLVNPVATLSAADKEKIYRMLAADLPGIYEAVPDGNVGKLLQKNISKIQRGASVVTNNAGFRDDRPFTTKPANTFRIVCLGDSFVEGTGGKVEDRFCNQIEEAINQHGLLKDGLTAETYALGVGSWNATNEASYMISHLSAYNPDLIIVLLVSNDLADGQGVSGIGTASNEFSPQNRALGSGIFTDAIATNFADSDTYLPYDFGPESTSRWKAAFSLYKRLEDLQLAREGKMIFSVLNSIRLFRELAMKYHEWAGMVSPFLTTDYFPDEQTALPHDSHPSRLGHQIIANHYIHAMARLGWIDAVDEELIPLHKDLSLETATQVDLAYIAEARSTIAANHLPQKIDFDDLGALEIQALLGGIWPDMNAPPEYRRRSFPFGSTKSGFLLARDKKAGRLDIELFFPPMPELYPNTIKLFINGELADTLDLASTEHYGKKQLTADLVKMGDENDIIEVIIRSATHWSTISDNTMRSYELRKAYQSRE